MMMQQPKLCLKSLSQRRSLLNTLNALIDNFIQFFIQKTKKKIQIKFQSMHTFNSQMMQSTYLNRFIMVKTIFKKDKKDK